MAERKSPASSRDFERIAGLGASIGKSMIEGLAAGKYPFPFNLLRRGMRPGQRTVETTQQVKNIIAEVERATKGK